MNVFALYATKFIPEPGNELGGSLPIRSVHATALRIKTGSLVGDAGRPFVIQ